MSEEEIILECDNLWLKPDGKIFFGEENKDGTYRMSPIPVQEVRISRYEISKFVHKIEVIK